MASAFDLVSHAQLGGPLSPGAAADAAAAVDARRLPEPEEDLVGDRAAGPALALVGRVGAGSSSTGEP